MFNKMQVNGFYICFMLMLKCTPYLQFRPAFLHRSHPAKPAIAAIFAAAGYRVAESYGWQLVNALEAMSEVARGRCRRLRFVPNGVRRADGWHWGYVGHDNDVGALWYWSGWGARAKPPMDNQSVIMHMKLETAIPSVTAHIGFPCTLPESPSPGDSAIVIVMLQQNKKTKKLLVISWPSNWGPKKLRARTRQQTLVVLGLAF